MTLTHLDFIRLVVAGDLEQVGRALAVNPELASMASAVGASRTAASEFFFTDISHYLYAGETALQAALASTGRALTISLLDFLR